MEKKVDDLIEKLCDEISGQIDRGCTSSDFADQVHALSALIEASMTMHGMLELGMMPSRCRNTLRGILHELDNWSVNHRREVARFMGERR